MLVLFKAKLPLDADEFDWMPACFKWFESEFGGHGRLRPEALTLPGPEIFPPSRTEGHALALELFTIVQQRTGMTSFQCDLVPGAAERGTRVATGLGLRHLSKAAPLGTFGYADGCYYISYNPSELERPQSLVATFAHEFSHYLLHHAKTPSPGGRELHEHATDLAAVYLGFGSFMVNSSKNFMQFQDFGEQGWEMRPQGYLSEMALTTGFALFVQLSRADPKPAEESLKDYLRKPFRRALKAIEQQHPDLPAAIDAIDLADGRD